MIFLSNSGSYVYLTLLDKKESAELAKECQSNSNRLKKTKKFGKVEYYAERKKYKKLLRQLTGGQDVITNRLYTEKHALRVKFINSKFYVKYMRGNWEKMKEL